MMTAGPTGSQPGQRLLLVVSWLLVGVPLLWGVIQTVQKAAQLFK